MTIQHINNVVVREIERSGCTYSARPSKTSDSIYYKLKNGKASLLFRVSNHATTNNVITLRFDRKMNDEVIHQFIKKCIDSLQKRAVKGVLGL